MAISVPAILVLAFLIAQRIGELILARRNTLRLMKKGAREVGSEHYPFMVALHSLWLIALVYFGWSQPIAVGWFVIFVILQMSRLWIIHSLGGRWTTRIIVLDEPLVEQGPFAMLKHPNYLLVVAEIFVIPMMFGLPVVAAVFSALNAAMLVIRVGVEEEALADNRRP